MPSSIAAGTRRSCPRPTARATSRTACRCASRTRSRATPCARSTSTRASRTSTWRPASRRCSTAMDAQWRDMAGRKAYVTGGVGAHHMDEAFGDAYELPPDRCYGETCAAIASVLWNWRMLLVTGEARFADLLERTLYNGVLAGLALDGERLLLRQPAARARGPSRPGRARRSPPAVVRVRVLPAERDAAAREPAALRRDARRRRRADPSVHDRHLRSGARAHGLPVGWARRGRGARARVRRQRARAPRGGRRGSTAGPSSPAT